MWTVARRGVEFKTVDYKEMLGGERPATVGNEPGMCRG